MRPRGYLANYRPRQRTLDLLAKVEEVLETYRSNLPLTVRQIFYRLVATVDYPKDENAYERLQGHLVNFRRAGLVPFEYIRDDGSMSEEPFALAGPDAFLDYAETVAEQAQGIRQSGQAEWLEVWCEAGGMVPQLVRTVEPFGITVYSSGSFDSLTVKYEASRRIRSREVPTLVFHIGDHDPSGLSLFESMSEDVEAFVGDRFVRFERVAVTPAQIERFDLPTALPKATDRRSAWRGGPTAQAEGLPPDILAAELTRAIEETIDPVAYEEAIEIEAEDRNRMKEMVNSMRNG